MPGDAADSGTGYAAAGNRGLERQGQPETDEDQLAVHSQEGQEGLQVRTAAEAQQAEANRPAAPKESLTGSKMTSFGKLLGKLRSNTAAERANYVTV